MTFAEKDHSTKNPTKKASETMPGPSTNSCTLVLNPLKQTNKMTRQEIIDTLKDAKTKDQIVETQIMTGAGLDIKMFFDSYLNHPVTGSKIKRSWDFNFEYITETFTEIDSFGNHTNNTHSIRFKNIVSIKLI